MRHHPLTPMTDANLVRVLQAQLAAESRDGRPAASRRPGRTSRHRRVGGGDRRALQGASRKRACRSRSPTRSTTTICCASAPRSRTCRWSAPAPAWRSACPRTSASPRSGEAAALPAVSGFCAIVSGSCSEATRAQVAHFERNGGAARRIDPLGLGAGAGTALVAELARWAEREWTNDSATAGARLQHRRARSSGGRAIALGPRSARCWKRCSPTWPGRWSSAARAVSSSPAARPPVPASRRSAFVRCASARRSIPACPGATRRPALAPDGLHLALKSGNFGGVDFFTRAFAVQT